MNRSIDLPRIPLEYRIEAFNNFVHQNKIVLPNSCWVLNNGTTKTNHRIYYDKGKYIRTRSYRMWFITNQQTCEMLAKEAIDVSHLCHNEYCINPSHLCLEHHNINLSRNLCQGAPNCKHNPPCLAPGSQCNDETNHCCSVTYTNGNLSITQHY